MTRSKTHKRDEDLLSEIRELKATNRALKKRMRQLEKNKKIYEQLNLDEEESEESVDTVEICQDCGKGAMITINLGIKVIHSCTLCKFRKVTNG